MAHAENRRSNLDLFVCSSNTFAERFMLSRSTIGDYFKIVLELVNFHLKLLQPPKVTLMICNTSTDLEKQDTNIIFYIIILPNTLRFYSFLIVVYLLTDGRHGF